MSAYSFDYVSVDTSFHRSDTPDSFFTAYDGLPNSGSICPSPVQQQRPANSRPTSFLSSALWNSLADGGYHDQGPYSSDQEELCVQPPQRPLTPYSSFSSLPPSRSCTPASYQLPSESYQRTLPDFQDSLQGSSVTTRSPSPTLFSSFHSPASTSVDYNKPPPFDASSLYLTSTPSSLSLADLPPTHDQDYNLQPTYEDPLFQPQPRDDLPAAPVQLPSTMLDYPHPHAFPFYSNPHASSSATSLPPANHLDQLRLRESTKPKRFSAIHQRTASPSPLARPLSRAMSALSFRPDPVTTARPGYASKPPAAASHSEMSFVNFTTRDRRKLLSGVAPSGSSKTKARREKLAKEKINKRAQ